MHNIFKFHFLRLNVVLCMMLINICASTKKNYGRPEYIPVCFRNDPQLNQCLLNATEQIRPYLARGVSELRIPPFEPFIISKMELQQGTSALNFKAILTNISAHGLTNYRFHRFDFNVPGLEFFCESKIPHVVLSGDYLVTGRILIAPIEGKGQFIAEIESCDVFVYQKYKETTLSDKKVHLAPVTTNSSIQVQKPKVRFEGLFGGNKELALATNKVINDNADVLFEELKPVLETTISKIMEDVFLKSIMDVIPWADLYPVSPNF